MACWRSRLGTQNSLSATTQHRWRGLCRVPREKSDAKWEVLFLQNLHCFCRVVKSKISCQPLLSQKGTVGIVDFIWENCLGGRI